MASVTQQGWREVWQGDIMLLMCKDLLRLGYYTTLRCLHHLAWWLEIHRCIGITLYKAGVKLSLSLASSHLTSLSSPVYSLAAKHTTHQIILYLGHIHQSLCALSGQEHTLISLKHLLYYLLILILWDKKPCAFFDTFHGNWQSGGLLHQLFGFL